MKRIDWLAPTVAFAMAFGLIAYAAAARGQSAEAAPVYGIRLPDGYRDWRVISVAQVGGDQNDLRVKLGNDIAIDAYRRGLRVFPDGAIIARLAYRQTIPEADNELLRGVLERRIPAEQVARLLSESRVAGEPTNVQFMVKDSQRYASTGGWGFAQFTNGHPDNEALHRTCFSCHEPARARDFVFTRYAP